MAIISGFTIIRAISLFHITAAYLFLTSPRIISDQNVVFMLGESMGLVNDVVHGLFDGVMLMKVIQPHATTLDKPSEASAFAGVLLAFIGIADLTAASMEEVAALGYWLSNVPVRLAFLFGLTGYVFLFKEDGIFGSGSAVDPKASIGEPLQNSLVFTFGFFEIAAWFWIFTSLREERRQLVLAQVQEKLKFEEDRL